MQILRLAYWLSCRGGPVRLGKESATPKPHSELFMLGADTVLRGTSHGGKMMAIISAIAKKGGVGKSTITANLAGYLATAKQEPTLMIDCDPQASISQSFLGPTVVERLNVTQTTAAVFDDSDYQDPDKMIHEVEENLYLVPSNELLEPYHLPLTRDHGRQQFALYEFIQTVEGHFAHVVCDTPPNFSNLLAWNCLMIPGAYTVTPLNMETFSAQSVPGVIAKLEEAHANGNPDLQSLGYVINLRTKNRSLHEAGEKAARRLYGAQVFDTVLHNWTAFAEAQSKRTHIFRYAPDSREAKASQEFAEELLGRIEAEQLRRAA